MVKIGGVALGGGDVKVCVSVAAGGLPGLFSGISYALSGTCDIIEWRADYWEEKGNKPFDEIKEKLSDKPLIFTYRTSMSGGLGKNDNEEYYIINKEAISSGCIDAIDIELEKPFEHVRKLTEAAVKNGVRVIASKHVLRAGVKKDEIIKTLIRIFASGCDIAKIAVLTEDEADAAEVINAAEEMYEKYAKKPFITAGMGEAGKITRKLCPFYGSSMTYAKGLFETAPGQLSALELKVI